MWVLQCVIMCCTVLQYALEMTKPVLTGACCSVLQCVAVCSELFGWAVCEYTYMYMYIYIYIDI